MPAASTLPLTPVLLSDTGEEAFRIKTPSIYRVDRGQGYPIVLIHGLACSSDQWMYTVPFLESRGFRAIALDLPGFGKSYLPKQPISTSSYPEDVIRLLDELRIAQAVLVGNSMGGMISWMTAVRYPNRVKAMVLVDPAGAPMVQRDHNRTWPLQRGIIARVANSILAPIIGSDLLNPITRRAFRPVISLAFGDISKVPDEAFEALHRSGKQARILFSGRLKWIPFEKDPGSLLKKIRCPTLIIWGDQDHIIPIASKDFFLAHMKNAKEHVFPGVGHVPMLEVPKEFNLVLEKFLREVVSPTSGEPWADPSCDR